MRKFQLLGQKTFSLLKVPVILFCLFCSRCATAQIPDSVLVKLDSLEYIVDTLTANYEERDRVRREWNKLIQPYNPDPSFYPGHLVVVEKQPYPFSNPFWLFINHDVSKYQKLYLTYEAQKKILLIEDLPGDIRYIKFIFEQRRQAPVIVEIEQRKTRRQRFEMHEYAFIPISNELEAILRKFNPVELACFFNDPVVEPQLRLTNDMFTRPWDYGCTFGIKKRYLPKPEPRTNFPYEMACFFKSPGKM